MSAARDTPRYRTTSGAWRLGARGRATRQALLDAINVLLQTTPWRSLTVQAVTDFTDLSTAAFYQHFPSLEEAVLELDETIERSGKPRAQHLELLVALLRFERAGTAADS